MLAYSMAISFTTQHIKFNLKNKTALKNWIALIIQKENKEKKKELLQLSKTTDQSTLEKKAGLEKEIQEIHAALKKESDALLILKTEQKSSAKIAQNIQPYILH